MLCRQAIRQDTLDTLKRIQLQPELSETRLVGGTALALQFGHRLSIDIDLFGVFDRMLDLQEILGRCGSVNQKHRTENIRVFNVNDIKVDVVYYDYLWLSPPLEVDGVRIAEITDIAPMKLEAINSRGSKKDFIDMFFLLQHFTLSEMLDLYRRKYPAGSEYLILRSLVYFDDAEDDPMPIMLKPIDWEGVKERIRVAVRKQALA
ncbi:MAG: nucleotidyl transferase AbiEii/AbiGii toxin family protein [Kiritimatiellae bacterium]|nr:nucleotidyl transferase AbiEii/AbiGii toxin family protein [Kiritimatiellia bacterium]